MVLFYSFMARNVSGAAFLADFLSIDRWQACKSDISIIWHKAGFNISKFVLSEYSRKHFCCPDIAQC